MKVVRTSLLLVLSCAVSLSVCQAQNSFGTIVGIVVDQSGAVVAGAPVTVRNTATGEVDTVRTQSDGNYTAINLIPGPSVVSVELSGFSKTLTNTINLTVNQTLRADLTLRTGKVDTTVQVSATQTLLDTDSSTVSSEISTTQVADMPLASRNFLSLLELTPGTIEPPSASYDTDQSYYRTSLSGGAAFVGGGRSSSNGYLIDGIENNDPGFQTPTISVPIDAIQDMRLMTKDYSAEYGGAASQVNVATKSGSNQFHGTAYEFLQNDDLNATNQSFGSPAIKPDTAGTINSAKALAGRFGFPRSSTGTTSSSSLPITKACALTQQPPRSDCFRRQTSSRVTFRPTHLSTIRRQACRFREIRLRP